MISFDVYVTAKVSAAYPKSCMLAGSVGKL